MCVCIHKYIYNYIYICVCSKALYKYTSMHQYAGASFKQKVVPLCHHWFPHEQLQDFTFHCNHLEHPTAKKYRLESTLW